MRELLFAVFELPGGVELSFWFSKVGYLGILIFDIKIRNQKQYNGGFIRLFVVMSQRSIACRSVFMRCECFGWKRSKVENAKKLLKRIPLAAFENFSCFATILRNVRVLRFFLDFPRSCGELRFGWWNLWTLVHEGRVGKCSFFMGLRSCLMSAKIRRRVLCLL